MREFIFILFVFSGLFKSLFLFHGINVPVDFTLITSVLLLLDTVVLGIVNYKHIPAKIIYASFFLFVFFIWMIFTLLYSPSPSYKYEKTFRFILNVIAFLYPLWLGRRFNIKYFLQLFVFFSLGFSIWYLYVYAMSSTYERESVQFMIYASFYLASSFVSATSFLLLLTTSLPIINKHWLKIIVIILLLALMVMTRGRGPLLFALLLILLWWIKKKVKIPTISLVFSKEKLKQTILALSSVMIVGGIIVWRYASLITSLLLTTISRFFVLFTSSEDETIGIMGKSVATRIEQIYYVVDMFFKDILHALGGYGIGSFGFLFRNGIDGRYYPHNIFLEILFEMGLVGLLLFIIFIITIYWFGKAKYITNIVLLFLLLNVMKSSSIIDIRMSFSIFALFLLQGVDFKQEK
jgi:O-antigen ligase